MEPVTTAIIAAITAGVVSAAGDVGKQVVLDTYGAGKQLIVDAYNSLKTLLSAKFGDQSKEVQAINNLEAEPELEINKQMVQHRLAAAKANEDPELQVLAEKLLTLLKAHQQGAHLVATTQTAIGNYIAQASSGSIASVNVNTPKR